MAMTIALSQGQVAIVDDEDYAMLSNTKWYALWNKSSKTFYAVRSEIHAWKKIQIYMHRVVTNTTDPKMHVDHRNHIGTDNQKDNLRVCKPGLNHANRKYIRGKSKFKGVFWDQRCKKWFAKIVKNGRPLYLGIQDSEIEAARAYNTAASKLFGDFAFLNSLEV